jgi:hypothetical protein
MCPQKKPEHMGIDYVIPALLILLLEEDSQPPLWEGGLKEAT